MGETVFNHGFYYPDNHDIPLSDIAATLIAHERLLPVVSHILEKSLQGLTVQKISINLDDIKRSSLSETFFVAIFVVFQDELGEEVPAIIERITGYNIDDRYDTIITVLFLIALYAGTTKLLGKLKKEGAAPPPSIHGDYNTYINIAARDLNVSRERIQAAVESALGPKRLPSVMRAAIDLFRPAKRGGNGRIIPLGLPEISQQSVSEFPSDVALAEMEDDTVPLAFPDATLRIRAIDRDKSDRGWAGILEAEGVKTKRLPVKLYPTIDREALAALRVAQVEAILESSITEDGETKPKRIHILKVIGATGETTP